MQPATENSSVLQRLENRVKGEQSPGGTEEPFLPSLPGISPLPRSLPGAEALGYFQKRKQSSPTLKQWYPSRIQPSRSRIEHSLSWTEPSPSRTERFPSWAEPSPSRTKHCPLQTEFSPWQARPCPWQTRLCLSQIRPYPLCKKQQQRWKWPSLLENSPSPQSRQISAVGLMPPGWSGQACRHFTHPCCWSQKTRSFPHGCTSSLGTPFRPWLSPIPCGPFS